MQQILIALVAAAFIGFAAPPVSAQEIEIGPHGVGIGEHHHHGGDWGRDEGHHYRGEHRHFGGGYCRELRSACMHKDELGETGHGNCQRYRESCGG